MPEREVEVCSADEGQQAPNSCPELHIFFSLGIKWYFLHVVYTPIHPVEGGVYDVVSKRSTVVQSLFHLCSNRPVWFIVNPLT